MLPECDTRQDNAGERYKLNDKSKRLIPSDGRVEINSESGRSEQVDDPNSIAQIPVTHNFLLNDFLSMQTNVAVHYVGTMNRSVRNCV